MKFTEGRGMGDISVYEKQPVSNNIKQNNGWEKRQNGIKMSGKYALAKISVIYCSSSTASIQGFLTTF